MKKIIAVIGMAGSGKTDTIEYLQNKCKWPKVYFGDVIFDQMKKEGLKIGNWQEESFMRKKMRDIYGMGVCAKFSIPKIESLLKSSDTVLIESLYSWEEYKIMKAKYGDIFKTIAVYASPETRFRRIRKRKIRKLKSAKEFKMRDWHEIENTDKGGPIAIADFTINNESSMDDLHDNIDKVIRKIIK